VIFDRQTEQVLPLRVKDEGHFELTIPAAWYATEERFSRTLGEIALESGLNVENRARVVRPVVASQFSRGSHAQGSSRMASGQSWKL